MRLKLDENLGAQGEAEFRNAGHDVATVAQQGLGSASDATVLNVCSAEARCLVTLDMDFANPLIFRPCDYRGIAVLRLPAKPTHTHLLAAIETVIAHLKTSDVNRRLWIVEIGRVRIYQDDEFETDELFRENEA